MELMFRLCFLVLVQAAIVFANPVPPTEQSASRKLLEYDRHFGGSLAGYPDDDHYVHKRLVPFGAPGIVLAVFSLLTGCVAVKLGTQF